MISQDQMNKLYAFAYHKDERPLSLEEREFLAIIYSEIEILQRLVEKADLIMRRNSMFPGDIEHWEKVKAGKNEFL